MAVDAVPQPRPLSRSRLRQTVKFLLPLLALLVIWQASVALLGVNPRVFPDVPTVLSAGWKTILDGSLLTHAGASLLRVLVGTLQAIALAVPLGITMGVSKGISTFLAPPLDRKSVV